MANVYLQLYKSTMRYEKSTISNGYKAMIYWNDIACALLICSLMQMGGMNSVKTSRIQTLLKETRILVKVLAIVMFLKANSNPV